MRCALSRQQISANCLGAQVASLEKRAASAPAVEARKGQARQLARVESELADCRAELAKAGEKAQAAEAQAPREITEMKSEKCRRENSMRCARAHSLARLLTRW